MRLKILVLGIVLAAVAAAQNVDRVFHFANTSTPQGRQQVSGVIQQMTLIGGVSIDNSANVLALSGTTGQIALAEWLFNEVDKPAGAAQPTPQEFRVPGSNDEVVRVFSLANVQTPQALQEIVNMIRSLVEMRYVGAVTGPRVIAIRGTNNESAATEWLIGQLDRPVDKPNSGVRDFRMAGTVPASTFATRVFYVKNAQTPQALQEMINALRSITEIMRVVAYNPLKAIALRATADQAAAAEWLINELDKPTGVQSSGASPTFQLAGVRDGVARVFYPARTDTPQALQEVVNLVRATTNVQRAVGVNANKALVMRGSADQVARTDQLLTERAKQ